MRKPAADLSRLWADLPLADRFDAAATAGFSGVVVPFPYDAPAKEIERALIRNGLSLVMIASPPPNYTGGPRGFAAVPGCGERFAHDLRRAVRYCEVLQVPMLRLLAGPSSGTGSGAALRAALEAAPGLVPQTLGLLLGVESGSEAFLRTQEDAAGFVAQMSTPQIGLSWSLSAAGPDWQDDLRRYAPLIRHVTLDVPPDDLSDSGALPDLLRSLDDAGYSGWITAGYQTQGDTEETLFWLQDMI